MTKKVSVSHVNIRQSITFLVIKLILLELLAAIGVIVFMTASLSDFVSRLGYELPFFSIPIYMVLVVMKVSLTIYVVMQWLNEYYEISPDLILHRKGIIFRHEEKYPLDHMKLIDIHQTVLGRIFNYGTIVVRDQFKIERLDLYQIHNPVRYASVLEELLPDEIESIHEVRRHVFSDEKADISVN